MKLMKKTIEYRSETASTPRYALRKGHGFWELTFAGQHATFKHEKGATYVAYLLLNPPPEPIHGLALDLKARPLQPHMDAITEITDPATGQPVVVPKDALLQQRCLGLDDAEAAQALRRKQLQLEALLDDRSQSEPTKAEVSRELEAIYQFQKHHCRRFADGAQRTVWLVRSAMTRFQRRLAGALGSGGEPHPVLRPFAAHIQEFILIPSARHSGRGNRHARSGLAGTFTYERPSGVHWQG